MLAAAFSLLLATAAQPESAAASPPPTRAEPRVHLASYVRDGDYPHAALASREQGTVGFALAVGADGRVADCRVTQSSGSRSLDEATCRILLRRARFAPARDAIGERVADTYEGRLGWFLQ